MKSEKQLLEEYNSKIKQAKEWESYVSDQRQYTKNRVIIFGCLKDLRKEISVIRDILGIE